MSKNNEYDPTGSTDCGIETLMLVGNTINPCNVETADINGLYMDQQSESIDDEPANPVATYSAFSDNDAALTDWIAAVDNETEGAVHYFFGSGDKGAAEQSEVTLFGGMKKTMGVPNVPFVFTIDRISQVTYQMLRKLQRYKGTYHFWYETPEYFYGGDKGMKGDIVKVDFTYPAGGTEPVKASITINWKAYCEPVRDPRTW